jgi:predicted kinase
MGDGERCDTRLVLICGLPGAGKTTLAKRLAEQLPAVRLSPDEWKAHLGIDPFDEPARVRLEQQLWRHTQRLLELGQTVILEHGFWGRDERDEMREWARSAGIAVELHYLAVPFEELCRRLEVRNARGEFGAVPITRAHMERYAEVFHAPDAQELALFDRPAGQAVAFKPGE